MASIGALRPIGLRRPLTLGVRPLMRLNLRMCLTAVIAVVLWVYSSIFAYRAGCAENGAGNTLESIDFSSYSVWLMMLAIPLSAALLAPLRRESDKKTLVLLIAFCAICFPIASFVLYQIGEVGATDCGWRPSSSQRTL
jgi:hypothetical protein